MNILYNSLVKEYKPLGKIQTTAKVTCGLFLGFMSGFIRKRTRRIQYFIPLTHFFLTLLTSNLLFSSAITTKIMVQDELIE